MRSLADLLHLRNASTSSTASAASTTSTRSFGSPARPAHDQDAHGHGQGHGARAGTPTRGHYAPGHAPAQSMSVLQGGTPREVGSAAGKRQRAASTGVVRLMQGHAGGSTPNLLAASQGREAAHRSDAASVRSAYLGGHSTLAEEGREDLDLDLEDGEERGQGVYPRAPGRSTVGPARSSRRGGSSVSSMSSVAEVIAAESAARPASSASSTGPPSRPPSRPLPTAHQHPHATAFSSSSMPWGASIGRPPPSPSRQFLRSLAERGERERPRVSPIATSFAAAQRGPGSVPLSAGPAYVTPADKAAAIALRRRSRVRSNSASSALSLNLFGLGPSASGGPHSASASASASVAGSSRSSVHLDAIDLPAQKPAPIGVPLPATPVEAAARAAPPITVVLDTQHADHAGRSMSSYASSSTIRHLNASTTTLCEPATPRPVPPASASTESTPIATGANRLPSAPQPHVRAHSHKLSPIDAGVRVKRDLSTVSFWKDGLESELDGIWAGMADSPAGLEAHVQERETRRRPRPALVLEDSFNRRAKEAPVLGRPGPGVASPREVEAGAPPLSAVGRLANEEGKLASSGLGMPTSVSDISLTNLHFPMPPTHTAAALDTPTAREDDANEGDLTLQPVPLRTDSSNSARSSLSSGDGSSDLPWYSAQERAALRNSATSSVWNRMRSPTWSSTTGSVASPRTPAMPSFENVAALPEVEDGNGEAARGKGSNIDRLARLLLSFDGDEEEDAPAQYAKEEAYRVPEEDGICWGEAL